MGGFHSDFFNSKCFSHASHSFFISLGLLAYYTTFSSHVQASPASCISKISSKYQHCSLHPGGVHDLDCFGRPKYKFMCVWKPGNHTSKKTYTLAVQQESRNYCRTYGDIVEFSKIIALFKEHSMTVEVFENSESTNCTRAVFRGTPKSLLRCGPPKNVSFSRYSGRLHVNVSWQQEDVNAIKSFSVRYKTLGSLLWKGLLGGCGNTSSCRVENLNASVIYIVQIQCVTNEKCSQCPWSEAYAVPSELTTQPVIVNLEDMDIADTKGRRLISLAWKFSDKEVHNGYYVTVWKASGETPVEPINTFQTEIRLILSYSAYQLNIQAVNNVSISPAVRHTIPQRGDMPGMGDGRLNVTVHHNRSFTVYWKDDLIKNYVCYSAEWRTTGHKAVGMSFHEDAQNYRTLFPLPEPLEPYRRYNITLHTRPNKETCNMVHVNNSESTYGSTQFYFVEGFPVSAPRNTSSSNVTLNSVVLQWLPIPEEDIRGFLQGYIIYYTEYHHRGTGAEKNITVDPALNSYKLGDLKSGTAYQVQISGFTSVGAGVRSTASFFKTNDEGNFDLRNTTIVLAVVAIVLIFGLPIIKRAKVILWPNIPNPGNSNVMQKIDSICEMELLEAINTLKVEEWDTTSLQIVEKETMIPASTQPSIQNLLHPSEDEGDSTEITCNWMQEDTDTATGDTLPDDSPDVVFDVQLTDHQSSPFAFISGYTTMEMFQQGMTVNTPAPQAVKSKPEDTDLTVVNPGLNYVRQFSNSPICDRKHINISMTS